MIMSPNDAVDISLGMSTGFGGGRGFKFSSMFYKVNSYRPVATYVLQQGAIIV